ncbi:hypothetical protein ABH912_003197 [Pseudomonas sp. BT76 TE3572]|uniref:hypothetical protein n=1 Tax=Pseudomonas TaxID=286 RepID=UPI003D2074B2
MYEFLLAEKHFVSLKNYFKFLQALPVTFNQYKSFSESLQRQGHVLTTLPDTQRLTVLASFSTGYLDQLARNIAKAGKICDENLIYLSDFIQECRVLAKESPRNGRGITLRELDFKRFSLSRSPWWIWVPPTDVKGLTHELYFRLNRATSAIMELKAVPLELNLDIHTVFSRFVRSWTLKSCQCHSHYSRIEAWYVEGGFSLSGMKTPPAIGGFRGASLAQSKEHLRELVAVYTDASSAINNLSDFLYAMCGFSSTAEKELLAVKPTMKLSQLISSLAQVEYVLKEFVTMRHQIQQWSR